MSDRQHNFALILEGTEISEAPLEVDFGRLTPAEHAELNRLSAKTGGDFANINLLDEAEKNRWLWLGFRIWNPATFYVGGLHGTGQLTNCHCLPCTHYSIYHKGNSNV